MNPGYLSLVIALMALILLASGWKDILLQGLSYRAVYLFFLCWIVSFFVHLQLGTFVVGGVYIVFSVVVWMSLYRMRSLFERLQAVMLSLLLGSTVYLMVQLTLMSPALSVKHPVFHTVFVLALLTIVMQRKALHQITVITAALLMSDTLLHMYGRSGMRMVLGGPELQDEWWQSVATARLGTVLLQVGAVVLHSISVRKSVGRKDGEE